MISANLEEDDAGVLFDGRVIDRLTDDPNTIVCEGLTTVLISLHLSCIFAKIELSGRYLFQ